MSDSDQKLHSSTHVSRDELVPPSLTHLALCNIHSDGHSDWAPPPTPPHCRGGQLARFVGTFRSARSSRDILRLEKFWRQGQHLACRIGTCYLHEVACAAYLLQIR